LDGATRSLAYQAGSFAQNSGPAPGGRAELFAIKRALAQLSEAAARLMTACQSCQSTRTMAHGQQLSPSEVTPTATGLLTAGARTVHAVVGRPDLLGLLTRGPLLQALGESSAQTRILCLDVLRAEMAGRRALSDLALSGAQVATTPAPPPPVLIVDRQAAIVSVAEQDANGVPGAMLIHDPVVIGYLAAAVDAFWAIAAPVHDAITSDGDGLPPADRMLLRLLAEGMTQQEVARRLQLSVRTISRRTAELKRSLGAASPLQAGLEAARRGWL
jgi:DNA-binding NarL/FixJ family response regulator